jgi:hypothetical protein
MGGVWYIDYIFLITINIGPKGCSRPFQEFIDRLLHELDRVTFKVFLVLLIGLKYGFGTGTIGTMIQENDIRIKIK